MTHLKPFQAIPGPKSFPLIGTLPKYLPVVGSYSLKRLHRTGLLKYKEYGPLVRENIVGKVNLLHVFDPNDICKVFANDGKYPFRRSHTALLKYRLERPQMYTGGGLLPTNGEEWWRLRKEAQKVMTRIPCVRANLPAIDEISQEFLECIKQMYSAKESEGFLPFLEKVFLEMTVQTTVDYRINCFEKNIPPESEAAQLIWGSKATNKSTLGTDNGLQLWKWFNTPLYKQLSKGQDTIYKIGEKYVKRKEREIEEKRMLNSSSDGSTSGIDSQIGPEQLTSLEYFILKSSLSRKDILTLVCDSLLAGTDTSAYTMSFVLYHLAKNPKKQAILADEATKLLSASGGKVTEVVLRDARYAKAVVKESLRLNPISIGVGRIATRDFELRGYSIPRETVIVTQNQVSCRLEEYFPNATQFIPERWLDKTSQQPSPFLLLPFGHGPRACIGRRMAEQNIYCLLLQICSRFEVQWKGVEELDCYSHLINEPDDKLLFEFIERV